VQHAVNVLLAVGLDESEIFFSSIGVSGKEREKSTGGLTQTGTTRRSGSLIHGRGIVWE
jgi:hypothetical protein